MRWTTMALLFFFLTLFASYGACGKAGNSDSTNINPIDTSTVNDTTMRKMKVKIGTVRFQATLANNVAAKAFQALLPLTVNMTELNGNEKYYDLSTSLPVNATNPGTIQSGDLMLWGNKTLVVFYKTFSTSYNYTRLGVIDNPQGLATAVGAGNVSVSFEL